jgi:hypothetical protein
MSMMEKGDEVLGFEREIYWLNGQAEICLDSVPRRQRRPGSDRADERGAL